MMTLIALLTMGCLLADHSASEQTHFSAGDQSVARPIALPQEALRIILQDPGVADVLRGETPPRTQIPAEWLMASEVHLAGPSERDIVVVASGPLCGANVTTFWILRPLKQGYELLSTAVVHDLLIKHTRSNGYKEIELLSATAVTVSIVSLRFDGKRYETHARKSRSIR